MNDKTLRILNAIIPLVPPYLVFDVDILSRELDPDYKDLFKNNYRSKLHSPLYNFMISKGFAKAIGNCGYVKLTDEGRKLQNAGNYSRYVLLTRLNKVKWGTIIALLSLLVAIIAIGFKPK